MKLVVAGGGTGGHLFPGIAVAEEFLSRDAANEVLFVGSERGIEARAIPRLGYHLELISAAGIRGKGSFAKIKGALMLLYGYAQSRKILRSFQPDMVLGVGGYASLPVVFAANGMDIPRFVHEQNAMPGMSNRALAKVASKVFISLQESARFFPAKSTVLTGNPLRRQIIENLGASLTIQGSETAGQGTEETVLSPCTSVFHLFVFGGSQGAHSLNIALPEAVAMLDRQTLKRLEIVHQTGEKDLGEVAVAYQKTGVRAKVKPFIDDMATEYRRADLVVCRAGATTIAEITALGKACLFIPFPHATDEHQRKNAESLLKSGACEMLLEDEIPDRGLARLLEELMNSPQKLKQIGERAAGLARLDSAQVIVDEMLKVVCPFESPE